MNCNNYTVTMTYSDLVKWQKIETDYNALKKAITDCYEEQENDIMLVNVTELKAIGKSLLPNRYQDYNYTEVH